MVNMLIGQKIWLLNCSCFRSLCFLNILKLIIFFWNLDVYQEHTFMNFKETERE